MSPKKNYLLLYLIIFIFNSINIFAQEQLTTPRDSLIKAVKKRFWEMSEYQRAVYVDEKKIDGVDTSFFKTLSPDDILPVDVVKYIDNAIRTGRNKEFGPVDVEYAFFNAICTLRFIETSDFIYLTNLDYGYIDLKGIVTQKSEFYERVLLYDLYKETERMLLPERSTMAYAHSTLMAMIAYNNCKEFREAPFKPEFIFHYWLIINSPAIIGNVKQSTISWVKSEPLIMKDKKIDTHPDFNPWGFFIVYNQVIADSEYNIILERIINNKSEWGAFKKCAQHFPKENLQEYFQKNYDERLKYMQGQFKRYQEKKAKK